MPRKTYLNELAAHEYIFLTSSMGTHSEVVSFVKPESDCWVLLWEHITFAHNGLSVQPTANLRDKQIIEAIKNLTLSKSINKLSTCKFSLKYKSLEHGICTSYGSCRFHGNDFMNQVCDHILKANSKNIINIRVAAPFWPPQAPPAPSWWLEGKKYKENVQKVDTAGLKGILMCYIHIAIIHNIITLMDWDKSIHFNISIFSSEFVDKDIIRSGHQKRK